MGYIVKNWKIKFICVFWYDGDNYRIFENVLNIYHITLFHVLNLKTQACTSCLFPNYTIINIINFYRQKMCVYCTRAVRKVRGQVPIFLKNNMFFKNVSDTCIRFHLQGLKTGLRSHLRVLPIQILQMWRREHYQRHSTSFIQICTIKWKKIMANHK
jgi:hypothetical protein